MAIHQRSEGAFSWKKPPSSGRESGTALDSSRGQIALEETRREKQQDVCTLSKRPEKGVPGVQPFDTAQRPACGPDGGSGGPAARAGVWRLKRCGCGLRADHGDRCGGLHQPVGGRILSDFRANRRNGCDPDVGCSKLPDAGGVPRHTDGGHPAAACGAPAAGAPDHLYSRAGHHRIHIGDRGHHCAGAGGQLFRRDFAGGLGGREAAELPDTWIFPQLDRSGHRAFRGGVYAGFPEKMEQHGAGLADRHRPCHSLCDPAGA